MQHAAVYQKGALQVARCCARGREMRQAHADAGLQHVCVGVAVQFVKVSLVFFAAGFEGGIATLANGDLAKSSQRSSRCQSDAASQPQTTYLERVEKVFHPSSQAQGLRPKPSACSPHGESSVVSSCLEAVGCKMLVVWDAACLLRCVSCLSLFCSSCWLHAHATLAALSCCRYQGSQMVL